MKRKAKEILTKVQPGTAGCPLHEKLADYIGYCLYKSANQIRAKVDEHLKPFGVIAPQFGILVRLEYSGAKTQGELCQDMAMDKATMVRMIDGLEEKNFVTRVPSKEDRRANHLELTKTGRNAMLKMDKARRVAENEFLAPLSMTERKQLTEIVSKLVRPQSE